MADCDFIKICRTCGIEKPLSDFLKRSDSADGFDYCCKECERYRKRVWRSKNAHMHRAASKKWSTNNPDLVRGYRKNYKANNPGKINARNAKRRAAQMQATPSWANNELITREYELAAWCTKVMGVPYHVDHVIPLQGEFVCGLHVENNLRVIPGRDNMAKNNAFDI